MLRKGICSGDKFKGVYWTFPRFSMLSLMQRIPLKYAQPKHNSGACVGLTPKQSSKKQHKLCWKLTLLDALSELAGLVDVGVGVGEEVGVGVGVLGGT